MLGHLLHHLKLLDHARDIFNLGATTSSNPLLPTAINDANLLPLATRHGENDGLHAVHLILINVHILEHASNARQHSQQLLHRTHAPNHLHLLEEVIKGELSLGQLLGGLIGLLLIHLLLGALHQTNHVAHAQDAAGNALWMELFQRVKLLTRTNKFHRRASHALHTERSATTGIAIEFRQDDAVHLHARMECLGTQHRILPGHCINHQQDVVRLQRTINLLKLLHELIVHMQSTGSIKNQNVELALTRRCQRALTDAHCNADRLAVFSALVGLAVERHATRTGGIGSNTFNHNLQLLHRGGSLQIGGRNHDALTTLLKPRRQFAAGGCLTAALQSAHHHNGWPRLHQGDPAIHWPHQCNEALMNDAHHLLARLQTLGDFLTERVLDAILAEAIDHFQIDIGLKERSAHLSHCLTDIGFGNPTSAG